MIPTEPESERENEKAEEAEKSPQREAEALTASARWFHWEISATGSFPTARDVEQRFEERLRRWRAPQGEPPADVFIVDQEIAVQMDLPGVEEEDVQARIEEDCLIVEATRRLEAPSPRARIARLERPRGPLQRRVPLPFAPGRARIALELSAGVLLVRIVPEQGR